MKKVLLTMLVTLGFLAACSEDKLKVIHNNDRVADLERRAALNDQLNALQNQRLDALEANLQAEQDARIAGDLQLNSELQAEINARAAQDVVFAGLLADEEAARIAGDDSLQADLQLEIANRIAGDQANSSALMTAVFAQSLSNWLVQGQISLVNNKIAQLNSKLSTLTTRVKNVEDDLNDLENEVADLAVEMAGIEASLQGQINALSSQQAATQAQLDREGVKLFKCNSSSSSERIMKINGKFYAVMNRVTTQSVKVVTTSSSQTYVTPDMCETFSGDLKLPNSGGQCTPNSGLFKSTKVPGTSVVVPSYSTANVTVVTGVKIALDILTDGGYATTDGGPACSFSIGNGGTTQTGLVPVQ